MRGRRLLAAGRMSKRFYWEDIGGGILQILGVEQAYQLPCAVWRPFFRVHQKSADSTPTNL